MKLNQLADKQGARRTSKRLGRGPGSGKGKTAGRGVKGQKSRSGVSINGFEGGQMPIHMRLPKRGFHKPNALKFAELNIGRLQQALDAGAVDAKGTLSEQALVDAGVIRRLNDGIRLLGKGELTAKVSIEVTGATKGAVEAVEKAGGSVTILPAKRVPQLGPKERQRADKSVKKTGGRRAKRLAQQGGDAA
jgi:large subunit ribosomal protein L15